MTVDFLITQPKPVLSKRIEKPCVRIEIMLESNTYLNFKIRNLFYGLSNDLAKRYDKKL